MEKTLPLLRSLLIAWLCALAGGAHAQTTDPLIEQARQFVLAQLTGTGMPRVEVSTGRLDARLRLAPCERVQPFVPNGVRLWGKARVGLRCVKGVTPWSVYLPITVNVFGPAMVSTTALPAGHVLASGDFRQAEINLAEDTLNPPVTELSLLLGRTLATALTPGQSLRERSLKSRQWFAAGERVLIRVAGPGFAVAGSGEAVTAGMEGQPARVRTESGRVVSGMPVAERQLEIAL